MEREPHADPETQPLPVPVTEASFVDSSRPTTASSQDETEIPLLTETADEEEYFPQKHAKRKRKINLPILALIAVLVAVIVFLTLYLLPERENPLTRQTGTTETVPLKLN